MAPAIESGKSSDVVRDQDRLMLVLAYLGLFALIPLLAVKDSEYVRWHSKNGLVYSVGVGSLLAVLSPALNFIPVLGCLTLPFVWLAFFAVVVVAIKKALEGIRWRIPLVSDIAEKL